MESREREEEQENTLLPGVPPSVRRHSFLPLRPRLLPGGLDPFSHGSQPQLLGICLSVAFSHSHSEIHWWPFFCALSLSLASSL